MCSIRFSIAFFSLNVFVFIFLFSGLSCVAFLWWISTSFGENLYANFHSRVTGSSI